MLAAPWRRPTAAPAAGRWLAAARAVLLMAGLTCAASRSASHLRSTPRLAQSRPQVPDDQAGAPRSPLILFTALHKAGSMALADMQWDACYMANATIVSNNGPPPRFRGNEAARFQYCDWRYVDLLAPETLARADAHGQAVCAGPIRTHIAHGHLAQGQRDVTHVLLVRHPLDMLVSAYYSFGWSHADDGSSEFAAQRALARAMTVNEYALNRTGQLRADYDDMHRTLATACRTQPGYRCVVLSYELMMSAPRVFASRLAAAAFDRHKPLAVPVIADALAAKYGPSMAGILSAASEGKTHVRSGVPGNFRAHLNRETVVRLEATFADIIALIDEAADGARLSNLYDLPKPTQWV